MALAEDTLARLLQRAERAALTGSDRAIQVRFNADSLAYWHLSLHDRDKAHERFLSAQRAGAVELKWSRQGGDDRPLEIVRLRDLRKLAEFLGAQTVNQAIESAAGVLAPWRERSERVGQILDRWRSLKTVRGLTSSSAADFAMPCGCWTLQLRTRTWTQLCAF